ncbi:hypothetical protein Ae168Ps1_2685c [Pseudonocardia sp. Ae168_Ps1]|nr:hypothetical protein Ae150APs1_2675c [Pseudonocardia sp. Ae150A_Ps1]OLL80279.1 hypothetical protein Ae168Ps1_2685c [Pseudonocardia sp. Ae168_Ps1]OLL85595.1 hypothetical protein Ae263Ps1_2650 [Pseudonocardia sp. Ae263_Ps1]OLL94377.1 hypothetical protein Ae356Ps1_4274c [Pseudonocardia sp. Ae356_Ps1]
MTRAPAAYPLIGGCAAGVVHGAAHGVHRRVTPFPSAAVPTTTTTH